MSEELMRKYRPETFEEFIGHSSTVDSILSNMGKSHKYLFHGERGCGKTTLARLIAGQLEVSDFDLHEIDAADKTGVEDARALKQSVPMMPMNGKNKIYIIDECHRLTGNAFDSLLKTIEEPPDHVYFVLCTTNIQKVPKTIRSRCKGGEYKVGPLNHRRMGQLLDWVIKEEELDIDNGVMNAIIEGSQGIPRDALGLLDKIKSLPKEDAIEIALQGTAEDRQVKELIDELLSSEPSWNKAREIIKGLNEEPERIRRGILGYLEKVLLGSKPSQAWKVAVVMDEFIDPFYDSGKPGLTLACYLAINAGGK